MTFFAITIAIYNINPGIIISINGSLIGFFNIYLIPILVHLKCSEIGK